MRRWKNGKPFTKTGDRSLLRFIVKEHALTRLSAKNLLRQWDDNDVLAYQIIDKHRKTMGYAVKKLPGKVENDAGNLRAEIPPDSPKFIRRFAASEKLRGSWGALRGNAPQPGGCGSVQLPQVAVPTQPLN